MHFLKSPVFRQLIDNFINDRHYVVVVDKLFDVPIAVG